MPPPTDVFEQLHLIPPQASTAARQVDLLTLSLLAMCTAVTAGIVTCILWFCWKYRRGSSADRAPRVGRWFSVAVETGWTVAPLLVFLALFGWSGALYYWLETPPPDAEVVYVVGRQWMWKIQHATGKTEIDELHVPLGRPVRLLMTSQDVIHDFYIPAFRVKKDVLPGRCTSQWFEATRVGVFPIFCSQFCGFDHSRMTARVVVMEPGDYARWLATNSPDMQAVASANFSDKRPGQPPPSPLAEEGARLYRDKQCITCHGNPSVAPPLDGLYGRPVLLDDGATVVADEAYLYESIVAPRARVVRGFTPVMPSFEGSLSPEQINALVEFIRSLREPVSPTGGSRP